MNYYTFSSTYYTKSIRKVLIEKGYILMTVRKFMKDYMLIEDPMFYVHPYHTDPSKRPKKTYPLNITLAFKNNEEIENGIVLFSNDLSKFRKLVDRIKSGKDESDLIYYNYPRLSKYEISEHLPVMENAFFIELQNQINKYTGNI